MSRNRARQLASEFLTRGDVRGWFEVLYAEAGDNYAAVPWADLAANPNLIDWSDRNHLTGAGKTALTIGCGYGDDAEFLAGLGFDLVAFDISPTAIAQCHKRFPNSPVSYQVADLFDPPPSWDRRFDFVFESYTLQTMPPDIRAVAIEKIASFIAPSGRLLTIARGRDEGEPLAEVPFPLTQQELSRFESLGLQRESFEDYFDREIPPARRFRATYTAIERLPTT
jgi:SAM-dependent methyltransferase